MVTMSRPQSHVVEPLEFASLEDLEAFLHRVDDAIGEALAKRRLSVNELLTEGYGDITVRLTLQGKELVVAAVRDG
jgi:hypothetical protein